MRPNVPAAMPSLVELTTPDVIRALVWRCSPAVQAVSSASVGGGVGVVDWVVNAQVPLEFWRTDLDALAAEVADELGLRGRGTVLLTAASIERWERATDGALTVDATIGISKPTWAASPDAGFTPWRPGTINVVAHLPVPMTHAAMVGAVITVTEAKAQALAAHGVPGTGTASDAVVILAPIAAWSSDSAGAAGASGDAGADRDTRASGDAGDSGDAAEMEQFAGPRSAVGAPLARATFAAIARRAAASGPMDGRS